MGASDKKYNLAIEICVMFRIGRDYHPEVLEGIIEAADRMSPWVSQYDDGSTAPSIGWMSTPKVREGGGIDRHYTVEIRPKFPRPFSEIAAYERYGESVAKNLVRLLPSDMLGVQSRLIVHGMFGETHRFLNQ